MGSTTAVLGPQDAASVPSYLPPASRHVSALSPRQASITGPCRPRSSSKMRMPVARRVLGKSPHGRGCRTWRVPSGTRAQRRLCVPALFSKR